MPSVLFFAPLALLVPGAALAAWLDARGGAKLPTAAALALGAVILSWGGVVLAFPAILAGPPRSTIEALLAILLLSLLAGAALPAARLVRDWRAAAALGLVAIALMLLVRAWPPAASAALALGAAAWPRACVLLAAATRRPLAWSAGALTALGAIVAALMLLVAGYAGGAGALARHHVTLQLSPADGADYTLRFPFFASDDPANATRMLAYLRASVRVTAGDATARVDANGTTLVVTGRGGARVESDLSFVQESGDAVEFIHYVMPDIAPIENGTSAMRVAWVADFSGGPSSCFAHDARDVALTDGKPGAFPAPSRLLVACA